MPGSNSPDFSLWIKRNWKWVSITCWKLDGLIIYYLRHRMETFQSMYCSSDKWHDMYVDNWLLKKHQKFQKETMLWESITHYGLYVSPSRKSYFFKVKKVSTCNAMCMISAITKQCLIYRSKLTSFHCLASLYLKLIRKQQLSSTKCDIQLLSSLYKHLCNTWCINNYMQIHQ